MILVLMSAHKYSRKSDTLWLHAGDRTKEKGFEGLQVTSMRH